MGRDSPFHNSWIEQASACTSCCYGRRVQTCRGECSTEVGEEDRVAAEGGAVDGVLGADVAVGAGYSGGCY